MGGQYKPNDPINSDSDTDSKGSTDSTLSRSGSESDLDFSSDEKSQPVIIKKENEKKKQSIFDFQEKMKAYEKVINDIYDIASEIYKQKSKEELEKKSQEKDEKIKHEYEELFKNFQDNLENNNKKIDQNSKSFYELRTAVIEMRMADIQNELNLKLQNIRIKKEKASSEEAQKDLQLIGSLLATVASSAVSIVAGPMINNLIKDIKMNFQNNEFIANFVANVWGSSVKEKDVSASTDKAVQDGVLVGLDTTLKQKIGISFLAMSKQVQTAVEDRFKQKYVNRPELSVLSAKEKSNEEAEEREKTLNQLLHDKNFMKKYVENSFKPALRQNIHHLVYDNTKGFGEIAVWDDDVANYMEKNGYIFSFKNSINTIKESKSFLNLIIKNWNSDPKSVPYVRSGVEKGIKVFDNYNLLFEKIGSYIKTLTDDQKKNFPKLEKINNIIEQFSKLKKSFGKDILKDSDENVIKDENGNLIYTDFHEDYYLDYSKNVMKHFEKVQKIIDNKIDSFRTQSVFNSINNLIYEINLKNPADKKLCYLFSNDTEKKAYFWKSKNISVKSALVKENFLANNYAPFNPEVLSFIKSQIPERTLLQTARKQPNLMTLMAALNISRQPTVGFVTWEHQSKIGDKSGNKNKDKDKLYDEHFQKHFKNWFDVPAQCKKIEDSISELSTDKAGLYFILTKLRSYTFQLQKNTEKNAVVDFIKALKRFYFPESSYRKIDDDFTKKLELAFKKIDKDNLSDDKKLQLKEEKRKAFNQKVIELKEEKKIEIKENLTKAKKAVIALFTKLNETVYYNDEVYEYANQLIYINNMLDWCKDINTHERQAYFSMDLNCPGYGLRGCISSEITFMGDMLKNKQKSPQIKPKAANDPAIENEAPSTRPRVG